MERKFNKPHPALEGFKEPRKEFFWLVDAFFRLHRRRMHGEAGYQPIPIHEMTTFSDGVLRLRDGLRRLFFRVIEETDNVVLYDHYSKVKEAGEEALAEASKKQPKGKKGRQR